jgi:thiosulfate/3-mercaptopyruvate sulfurtransferase
MKGESKMMCGRKAFWVVLLCMASLLGPASGGFCFGKKELETEKISVNLLREVERGGYQIVTTDELKAWIDGKKDMIIVDTMPYDASYQKNHVPGAVQFLFPKAGDMTEWNASETAGKSQDDYVKLLGPDKNKTIVVYCGFVKCDRSHNGAMWAVKLGYKNVYRYPGGIKGWKEAKYPVEEVK